MKNTLCASAISIGPEKGQLVLGQFDGKKLMLIPCVQFRHAAEHYRYLYWNINMLRESVMNALDLAYHKSDRALKCVGIDTWGVDFGLLDRYDQLIMPPMSHQSLLDEDLEEVWRMLSPREIFEKTGLVDIRWCTLYQLKKLMRDPEIPTQEVETMLLMPDLLMFYLTGERVTEYTNASTTMLMDIAQKCWDENIIDRFELPWKIFTPIDYAGSIRGYTSAAVSQKLGINPLPVAAVGTHDTASIFAAIPAEQDFAMCFGNDSVIVAVPIQRPIIESHVFENGFSIEGTPQRGYGLFRTLPGLGHIKQTLHFSRNADIQSMLADGDLDTDNPLDVRAALNNMCKDLICEYTKTLRQMWIITREEPSRIFVSGDIAGIPVICKGIARALQKPVYAITDDLRAIGNLAVQLIALGEASDMKEAHEIIANSVEITQYDF